VYFERKKREELTYLAAGAAPVRITASARIAEAVDWIARIVWSTVTMMFAVDSVLRAGTS